MELERTGNLGFASHTDHHPQRPGKRPRSLYQQLRNRQHRPVSCDRHLSARNHHPQGPGAGKQLGDPNRIGNHGGPVCKAQSGNRCYGLLEVDSGSGFLNAGNHRLPQGNNHVYRQVHQQLRSGQSGYLHGSRAAGHGSPREREGRGILRFSVAMP